eukprot:CAMPEP_0185831216 /NCGR_PEP_ID=MMETSP1353-20130828/1356_1 /TAXON_ID=1077150 /ORGANISM="Erythrolobus australicus, Strain CCMP3124" /LENGTH=190 /DNA_ID=CAMNT_0028529255 /DNA_START=5 /DNA_END=577 /DNA_ORIENTATION=-
MAFCAGNGAGHNVGLPGPRVCARREAPRAAKKAAATMAFWVTDGPNAATGERATLPDQDVNKIHMLDTIEEYEARVLEGSNDSGDSGVVRVVKIAAPWCRSCKASKRKVEKIVEKYSDVEFYELDYGQHGDYCSSELGVDVLPHFEIFVGLEGRKESFSCGWNQIYTKLDPAINRYRGIGSSDSENDASA